MIGYIVGLVICTLGFCYICDHFTGMCPACRGKGKNAHNMGLDVVCPHCNGSGRL